MQTKKWKTFWKLILSFCKHRLIGLVHHWIYKKYMWTKFSIADCTVLNFFQATAEPVKMQPTIWNRRKNARQKVYGFFYLERTKSKFQWHPNAFRRKKYSRCFSADYKQLSFLWCWNRDYNCFDIFKDGDIVGCLENYPKHLEQVLGYRSENYPRKKRQVIW